jgi:very-short-patch-repair endonuclease
VLQYTVDFWIPELSMVIEADGMMGHLRKADAIRDAALMETTEVDVQQVLHIISTSPEPIMEEICQALDNL